MNPTDYYNSKIKHCHSELSRLKKKGRFYPFLRLGSIGAAVVSLFLLFEFNIALAIGFSVIFMILFLVVVRVDNNNEKAQNYHRRLLLLNQNEIKALDGVFELFDPGIEYVSPKHPYTADLDIFGKSSVFQLLNRTVTSGGKDLLARWLSTPSSVDQLVQRQVSVDELSASPEVGQEFRVLGEMSDGEMTDPERISKWLYSASFIHENSWLVWLPKILPVLSLSALVISFWWKLWPFWVLISIQYFINWRTSEKVEAVHYNTSDSSDLLKKYSGIISLIEDRDFSSPMLVSLRGKFITKQKASTNISRLASLVEYLDWRLNMLVHFFVNTLVMWDLHWVYSLEKWKLKNRDEISGWFESLSHFDALISLANCRFNYPEWVMPQFSDMELKVVAEEAGHPLIHQKERITNPISIDKRGKILLVTGSNMAGKSTYLRTVGVNVVLALAGGPVCAKAFTVMPVKIYSAMRVSDSLEESTSSFYAELKRIKQVIDAVKEKDDVLFLMDEILKGTNSHDRHAGSVALIEQMIKYNGTGIIATHDLQLSELEEKYPGRMENYSFDVQVEGENLFFDYKLHKGVCKSMNATILMKKMGIEM